VRFNDTPNAENRQEETTTRDILPEKAMKDISALEIKAQLERLLASFPFRNSKRYSRFLRYVVDQTLTGNVENIKERTIGIEVFDKPADYDLSSDSTVRVAAGEIRRKIAQYYIQDGREKELRIELPTGSYIPMFRRMNLDKTESHLFRPEGDHSPDPALSTEAVSEIREQIPPPSLTNDTAETANVENIKKHSLDHEEAAVAPFKPVMNHLILYKWAIAVGFLLVLVCCMLVWRLTVNNRIFQAFWGPLLENPSPILLCAGDLNFQIEKDLPPGDRDLMMNIRTHDLIGPNDLQAIVRIATMLGRNKHEMAVMPADELTLADLRRQPTILTGAFNNQWSMRIFSSARFQPQMDDNTKIFSIYDKDQPTHPLCIQSYGVKVSQIHRDCGLIYRTNNTMTGQQDLIIAGLGPYGTNAASEFATNPEYLAQFLRQATKGWENHNIEIVIAVEVVNGRYSPPVLLNYALN
jgi:hypothetical protein